MTYEKINEWARAGESEQMEFKATTGQRREAAQTVCAMLNRHGGHVIFGVENGGRVVGQQIGQDTLRDIQHELGKIDPPVYPSVSKIEVGPDRGVVVVSVPGGPNKPYSYRGIPYQRVGDTTVEMAGGEYQHILVERLHAQTRWENQTADGWSAADLDHGQIVLTVEEAIRRGRMEDPGTRAPLELLRGLNLLLHDGSLTRAAAVLFGISARLEVEYSQCLLRVARFRGNTRTEFLDNRQFHGHAFELLRLGSRFLRESLPVAGRVLPGVFARVDEPMYPVESLREALANAICHRDYSIGGGSIAIGVYDDRLEITSSGTLNFGLTPDALFEPHESLPWNPLIAGVFYRRGIIERWGRGTIRMAELADKAGLPRPEIEDAGGGVTVRFRPGGYVPPRVVARSVSERQRAILSLLNEASDGLALREIVGLLGNGDEERRRVRGDLAHLRALGLAVTRGHGRGARWWRR
ncbi:MAG: putative DNA binding domain-containing protein [Gemmatimonadota bacterium]|nr:putative DNA binding domain-containing protein [Gemmatimonadota bacterium]MDE2873091.1 putative DNA binding domain-containing protein [Gemmatimonadota bacterium]